MGLIAWLFIITGAFGIAYGLNVLLKRRVEIYHKGEIRLYTDQAAVMIGIGFILAGFGASLIGISNFHYLAIALAIVLSFAYMGLRQRADQITENNKLNLPSQRKK